MSHTFRVLQLVGTFLPLYGTALTVIACCTLRRGNRAVALVAIPLVTLWLCMLFGERIAYDGNMLYVVLVLLYTLSLYLYYPVLIVLGAVWLYKRMVANESS